MAGERISGISSMAMRQVLAELCEDYRRRSGGEVAVASMGGVEVLRRVESGEAFDFVVSAAEAIEKLAASGRVDRGSRRDLTRSGVAIAVAAGAQRPAVGSETDLRRAVLEARSIGYSTGPSGTHLTRLFERWGISADIASRIVQAPPGVPVAALIARGEVELGFQQLSELIGVPGIEVIGPLPPGTQVVTVFSAAACCTSAEPDAVAALLAFLASPGADATKRRHGMEPA